MTDLAKRLLASIEQHGKTNVAGLYKLFPHEGQLDIDFAIIELCKEGWCIYNKSQVVEGFKKDIPTVRRSSKKFYIEQSLFNDNNE